MSKPAVNRPQTQPAHLKLNLSCLLVGLAGVFQGQLDQQPAPAVVLTQQPTTRSGRRQHLQQTADGRQEAAFLYAIALLCSTCDIRVTASVSLECHLGSYYVMH